MVRLAGPRNTNMLFPRASSPHLQPGASVSLVMRRVLYALVPGAAVCIWLFGWGVLVNLVLASATALVSEAAMLRLRRRPVALFLSDGSALVTGILLALALPALVPWWLTVVATAFAVVIAKHLYGGLGYNPFNPAMVGYVVALIAFPLPMTQWVTPQAEQRLGPVETVQYQFTGRAPAGAELDTVTAATPLDSLKTQLGMRHTISEIHDRSPVFGDFGAAAWEWVGLAFLAGGLWLLYTGVIRWHIPVGMLAGLAVCALVFYVFDRDGYPGPVFHLFAGGTMLGAFFIATDPVTASTTNRGRLIYGAGIGVLTYVIRTWGGYPDGVAFAVLLMNMAVPTIDHYTQPRVFGAGKE